MANEENNFENDSVGRLLGSLKRVDAPGDFDVRVRARVAAGRPSAGSAWLPMAARLAAGFVVLLVVGYVGFRAFGPAAVDQQPVASAPVVVDPMPVQKDRDPAGPAVISPSKEETVSLDPVRSPEARSRENDLVAKRPVVRTVSSTRGGGSRVMAGGIPTVITAPNATGHFTKETLSALGIDAANTGSAWTVGEVKQNSRAARSGLKAGDVIESVKGTSVRVRRGGNSVEIDLKP